MIRSRSLACPKARSGGGLFVTGTADEEGAETAGSATLADGPILARTGGRSTTGFAALRPTSNWCLLPLTPFAVTLGAEGAGLASEAVDDKTGIAWEEDSIAGTDVDLMIGLDACALLPATGGGPETAPDAAASLNTPASLPLPPEDEPGRWLLLGGAPNPGALDFRSALNGTVVAVERLSSVDLLREGGSGPLPS